MDSFLTGMCVFMKTSSRVFLCAMVLLLFWVVSCSTSLPEKNNTDKFGGVYRRVIIDDPFTLDPKDFNDRNSIMIANQIYDRLIETDVNFNFIPSIAKDWHVSKDKKKYTFIIRDDVYFHNGDKLNVDDIIFSLQRIRNGAALISKYLDMIKVYKGGDQELVIELKQPFPPILMILSSANASIVSKRCYEERGNAYFNHPIGTGPFLFDKWEHNKRIVLKANQKYFDGRPFLDGIEYNKLDSNEARQMFASGLLEDIAPFRIAQTDNKKLDAQEIYQPVLQTNIIFFDTKAKPFDDVRVRRAFILAFDKEDFYGRISDRKRTKAKGFIPRGIIGHDLDFDEYKYDLAEARRLLAVAGYPNGKGIGKIKLLRPKIYPYHQTFSSAISDYYKKIGVDVEVKHVEFQEIIKSHLDNSSQMINCEINLDLPEAFFSLTYFHSKYPFDFTNVNNSRIDKLLDSVLFVSKKEDRATIYKEIDNIICKEEALLINLYYDDFFDGYFSRKVHGVGYSALGIVYMRMNNIWLSKDS